MSSRGGRGGGRGRGAGRPQKAARVETDEQRQAGEARELVEQKKHELIEFIKQHPCLYDIAHQEHLNNVVTRVLWEEIAEKLGVDGENLICNNMWKNSIFAINNYTYEQETMKSFVTLVTTVKVTWWKNLRDQFRTNYKQEKSGGGGGNPKGKQVQWHFYKEMSFMKNYMYSRG